MGTFGTNRIFSVGRMVKVADRMRWGFAPAWVRFPPYLKCKHHTHLLSHTRTLTSRTHAQTQSFRWLSLLLFLAPLDEVTTVTI